MITTKINWNVRFKNPVFWATFIPSLLTFVYTLLGLFDIVPSVSKDEVVNVCSVLISFLSSIGVLTDMTTKGLSDSERAMTYTEPK